MISGMSQQSPIAIGWTTAPERALAEKIARVLVERRLVACAQISSPITSVYRWKDEICQETEFRLALKFPLPNAEAVHAALVGLHPYDCPQWVVTRADSASDDYLAWVHACTQGDAGES